MGNIYKGKIDSWVGGQSDDIRIQQPEVFALSTHYDIWSNPKRLLPFPSMVADETAAYMITMFEYANDTFYGLGVVSSTAVTKIFQKASDPITGSWAASTNGESASGNRVEKTFKAFNNYIYGGRAAGIWAWGDITGTPTFTDAAYNTAGAPICQGIVTSDDKLIIPCASGIALKNGAGSGPTDAWSTFNIVPSSFIVSDIVERGDYVYIAAYPKNLTGTSKVYIWDKVSDDPTDVIDFGEGRLLILDDVDGELIGISASSISTYTNRAKLLIRKWSGGDKALPYFDILSDDNTLSIYGNHCKFREGSKLVFGMRIKINGTTYTQLAAIGRKSARYPLAFTFDRKIDNDTALTGTIGGVFKLGDYVFAAHNDNGSVNRTINSITGYTQGTPTLITQRLNGSLEAGRDMARRTKKLTMAGLRGTSVANTTCKLTLYYKPDNASAYIKIREYNVNGGEGFEAGMADTDADGVPETEFINMHEWEFKVEHTQSSGSAPRELYEIVYAFEDLGSEIQAE